MTQWLFAAAILVLTWTAPTVGIQKHEAPPVRVGGTDTNASQKSAKEIYQENKSAIVSIRGEKKAGSGFFISADGKIVTNYHVVSGERAVAIGLGDGVEIMVDDVVAQDAGLDLAILQLKGNKFKNVRLGDSDRLAPGDSVVVISNPLGLESSVNDGLVSGIRKFDEAQFLQISAPVSPGSSGGPVFDRYGNVVGVAEATMRGGQNVNLAIPSNEVSKLLRTPAPMKLSQLTPYPDEAGATSQASLEKVKRYLQNEMWDEAVESLKGAVAEDEFDPVLRLAFGEVLFKAGRYDEPARQLQISRKLAPALWQATERLADAHLKIWETQNSLSDRVTASVTYEELAASQSVEDQASAQRINNLFPSWGEVASARQRANARIAQLDSPVGTWVDKQGQPYLFTVNRGWGLDALNQQIGQPGAFLAVSKDLPSGSVLKGIGYIEHGSCRIETSVEVRVSEHGTRLDVSTKIVQSVGKTKETQGLCSDFYRPFQVVNRFEEFSLIRAK
jgi:Trypsin-like peptidase domain